MQDASERLNKNHDIDEKQKEPEGVVHPVMMDVWQAAGGGDDMPGGMPDGRFDDASGAGGHGHDAVLVRCFPRSPSCRR